MLISDENSAVIPLNQATNAAAIGLHLDQLVLTQPKISLADAIKQLHSAMFTSARGDREDAPNVAIIVTDREGDLQLAIDEAEIARSKGISLSAVGIGSTVCIFMKC